jgi:hypothetical protein
VREGDGDVNFEDAGSGGIDLEVGVNEELDVDGGFHDGRVDFGIAVVLEFAWVVW